MKMATMSYLRRAILRIAPIIRGGMCRTKSSAISGWWVLAGCFHLSAAAGRASSRSP